MSLFIFSQINPLDNIEVQNIKSCEIISNTVHFQIINPDSSIEVKKVPKSQFIMTQIEQFSISIEANI